MLNNKNKTNLNSNKEEIILNMLTTKNKNKGNNANKDTNEYSVTQNYLPILTSHIQNSIKKKLQ